MSFKTVAGKVAKDLFTENDGQSYCPVRVVGGLLIVPSVLMVLGFGGWGIAAGKLALMGFVQVVGAMAGVVGVVFAGAVSLKAVTDRLPQNPPGGAQ